MKVADPIELDAADENRPARPRAEAATTAEFAGPDTRADPQGLADPEGLALDELRTVAPETLQILASVGC